MTLMEQLVRSARLDGPIVDVRVGTHWTVVVVETSLGKRAGLASTQIVHDLEHRQPAVREAGRLLGRPAREIAGWIVDRPGEELHTLTERSIGFAALNAVLDPPLADCAVVNAEELILREGRGKHVAIVGHFPFVPTVREVARACWVLELNPGPGDLPAEDAPRLLPQADVVAITGMALVNGTFESLAALVRPGAFAVVLGATTPLSPVLFDYGMSAVAGARMTKITGALVAVSQGASFRQIPGKELLTLFAPKTRN